MFGNSFLSKPSNRSRTYPFAEHVYVLSFVKMLLFLVFQYRPFFAWLVKFSNFVLYACHQLSGRSLTKISIVQSPFFSPSPRYVLIFSKFVLSSMYISSAFLRASFLSLHFSSFTRLFIQFPHASLPLFLLLLKILNILTVVQKSKL